jgi:O-antigen ligase/tetratricopeptide (TPR) repeat protein
MSLENRNKILIWGGLFSPLFFFKDWYAAYTVPKYLVFTIFLTLLAISNYSLKISRNHFFTFLAFLFLLLLTSLLGLDPLKSILSDTLHFTGLLQYAQLGLWLILLSYTLKEIEDWSQVFLLLGCIGFVISLYGLSSIELRLISTIGNPSEAGIMVLMCIFFYLLWYFESKHRYKNGIFLPIILMLYFVYQTKTRASLFAIPFAAFISLGVYAFKTHSRKFYLATIVLIIITLSILFLFPKAIQMGRLGSLNYDRIGFYKVFLTAFKQSPLWGYGIENFLRISQIHYDADLSTITTKLDKSHSIFFEFLLSGGLLLGFFLIWLFLRILKKVLNLEAKNSALILSFLTAYLFWASFSVDTFSTFLFLTVLLAYIAFLPNKAQSDHIPIKIVSLTIIPLGLIYVYFVYSQIITLNRLRKTEDISEAKNLLKNISLVVFPESTMEEFVAKSAIIQEKNVKDEFLNSLLSTPFFKKGSPHILNLKTQVLADLGKHELAIQTIQKSLKMAPYFAYSQKQLGVLYLQKNNIKDAEKTFEAIVKNFPKDNAAKLQLSAIYAFYTKDSKKLISNITKLDKDYAYNNLPVILEMLNGLTPFKELSVFYLRFLEEKPWIRPEYYKIILLYFIRANDFKNYNYVAFKAGQNLLWPEQVLDYNQKFKNSDAQSFDWTKTEEIVDYLEKYKKPI